jgi:predicted lactoylglutathione lyase
MTAISSVTLDAGDVAAAESFYAAIGVSKLVAVRPSDTATVPSAGFRGYTLSLVVAQPGIVEAYVAAALAAGGREVKPVKKSLWGYGGVVQAPDGALWKFACSAQKDTGPNDLTFENLTLLLGVADVKATKQFYVDHGLAVDKSYGSKYVQFAGGGAITLGLYKRDALAKDAGVPAEGSGSHAIQINADTGNFIDPDDFGWTGLGSSQE